MITKYIIYVYILHEKPYILHITYLFSSALGRIMNHAKNGNVAPYTCLITIKGTRVLPFYAKRHIAAHSQLCWHYGITDNEIDWANSRMPKVNDLRFMV